jgi:hypothetical protein
MTSSEPNYSLPIKNNADTISAFQTNSVHRSSKRWAVSTVMAASLMAAIHHPAFPTATYPTTPVSTKAGYIASRETYFQFENEAEVLQFMSDKADVLNLYENLPHLINQVFGNARLKISIFHAYDEDWRTLRIDIDSGRSIEDLTALEENFFALLEKDTSFIAALDHVTLCFV